MTREPDIEEYVFQDEPIEIPVTKRMVFKFGKPRKLDIVCTETETDLEDSHQCVIPDD